MLGPSEKLSPRQRECLKLYWSHRATSKEIARQLGIARSTVDGYFAEAVQALGARDRREAALLAFGPPPGPTAAPAPATSGGEPARVSLTPLSGSWLPLRTGAHNDLSIPLRLAWIFLIAVAGAIGFGALASGLHLVNDLFR